MKYLGHTWVGDNGGDYSTVIDDKFHLITWMFGENCHQMNILFLDAPNGEGQICIDCVPTRNEAMKTMVDWVADYKRGGFIGAEEVIRRSYIEYPTLYSYRYQVLGHLFFVIGNGYDWADGQITLGTLALAPWDDDEAWEHSRSEDNRRGASLRLEMVEHYKKMEAIAVKSEDKEWVIEQRQKEEARIARNERRYSKNKPLADDGRPVDFYPICQYSKITNVPDNVTDDWLLVAIEAGELLLARQDPDSDRSESNRKYVTDAMPRLYRMREERNLGK